jgi:hypothetical protein
MGACILIAPVVIASWPAITAAVTAAVSAMGFSLVGSSGQESAVQTGNVRTEMEVEDSEILEGTAGTAEQLVVERDGVRATFSRDARGALKLCLDGRGMTQQQLRKIGEELIGRVTQQYAYHRIVTELKERNMAIVDEQVTADRTVKLRVRSV